jgi:hypothetical protein
MFINKEQKLTTEARSHGEKQKKKGNLSPGSGHWPHPAKADRCFHAAITEVTESTEIRLGVACES